MNTNSTDLLDYDSLKKMHNSLLELQKSRYDARVSDIVLQTEFTKPISDENIIDIVRQTRGNVFARIFGIISISDHRKIVNSRYSLKPFI